VKYVIRDDDDSYGRTWVCHWWVQDQQIHAQWTSDKRKALRFASRSVPLILSLSVGGRPVRRTPQKEGT